MLKAINVTKSYNGKVALKDVSFSVGKGETFCLLGQNGAGKTTLISAVIKILGVTDTVSSPTFSIVNNYQKENEVFYHFDFYRLNHPDEALDIGLEEYLESGNLCLIEWAEKVSPHLPLEYDHFIIEVQSDESRILKKIKH